VVVRVETVCTGRLIVILLGIVHFCVLRIWVGYASYNF